MSSTHVVPRAPGHLPLLGHSVAFLRDPLRFLSSLPAHGDLVRVRLGPFETVVVCDPELTHQVLLDDRTFDKGGPTFERARGFSGSGLGTCPHSQHRRKRRMSQPAFHRARLPDHARVMTAQVTAATTTWQDGQALDIGAHLRGLTRTILLETMFSTSLPTAVTAQLDEDLTALLAGWYRRMFVPRWALDLPTPGRRRFQRAVRRLRDTCAALAADRQAGTADHHDLLTTLITAQDGDESGSRRRLTDTEIIDQLVDFMIGGTETISAALTWALYLLAIHPAVQQRLHAEADSVLAGRPATFDDVPNLRLTGQIFKETLRLHPSGWMITRAVSTETTLGGHTLPAGTNLVYSPYLVQRASEQYPHPDRFDPDRWAPQAPTPPPHSFIPFAAGARKCIGDAFALTEAAIILSTIAARWQVSLVPGQDVRPVAGMTLHPTTGMRLRVVRRRPEPHNGAIRP
ncbi:cytochrome P450 [Streptomyces humi]|uniref:cytochrome P450 n=1 Tax=Streptomyces humi TaxID=1428620 RepID=UPI00062874A2|nr:cytochrome P450 [Streptomyces humi]